MIVEGIVIRSVAFKEKDAMITLLCRDKIISFYARGVLSIKSKNASSVSLCTYGRYDLNEGPQSGLTLKEGSIIESFPSIMEHYDSLAVVSLITELTCKYVQGEDAKDVFSFLLNSLKALNDGFSSLTVASIYFAAILNATGIGLEVNYCVISHRKSDIIAISFEDGGFISKECFEPETCQKLDSRMLNIYRYIFRVPPEKIEHIAFTNDENQNILSKLGIYLYNQTGLRLGSLDLIEKI